ncbi:alpha/beta hydrolase-fold protein [Streptomyces sp. NPDC046866]|uniref:alpha/beta hydrolase n=1 Tax=Streptomyces sp. NPDC046866 TaxID=3154921 RepID=UPI003451EAF0
MHQYPQQAQQPQQGEPPQYGDRPGRPYGEHHGRRPPPGGEPGEPHDPVRPAQPAQSIQPQSAERSRRTMWISAALALVLLLAGGGLAAWKQEWFSGSGDAVGSGKDRPPAAGDTASAAPGTPQVPAKPTGDPDVQLPAGPKAEFKQTAKLDDGTVIAKTRLAGPKSGFAGDVWVWTPKEYDDPKYAKSGFPVLIALPGGNGYPTNYWADRSLGLQKAISEGVQAGTSLPYIVIMPVLNPDSKYYYDGSDIPGQPRMGTWIAEDVPDFTRANFRTYKSRDGWAFMGSSSGAFVGMKTLLQYPEKFKAVIASGGEIVPDSPLWRGHQAEMDANNPEKLARKLIDTQGPEVYINFQVGTKETGKDRMLAFQQQYGKGPVKTTIRDIQNGEHNGWHYVRGMKEGSLEWISKVLKAPKPESG